MPSVVDGNCLNEQTIPIAGERVNCVSGNRRQHESSFLCDSGTTVGITWEKTDLKEFKSVSRDIYFGDDSLCRAVGEGVHLRLGVRMLYAPDFKVKLFSPGDWLDNQQDASAKVVLTRSGGYLETNRRIKALLLRQEKLFALTNDSFDRSYFVEDAVVVDSTLFHQRLGHAGAKAMRKLGYKISPASCSICDLSKHHKNKYDSQREYASEILSRLHLDIQGPLEFGLNAERYFTVLVDDKSRMVFVGILKSKSDAKDWIKTTIVREQKRMSMRVSHLRSDNGSEVLSNEVLDFLNIEGIELDLTPTYEPALNGIAERVQDTLLEKMRCLLLESNLPHSFWPFALLAAVERYSVTPHRALKYASPLSIYSGDAAAKALLNRLRVFGSKCLVYPQRDDPLSRRKSKLDPSGEIAVFLTCPSTTTIEVYLLTHRRTGVFKHFKLLEGKFYSKQDLALFLSKDGTEEVAYPPESDDEFVTTFRSHTRDIELSTDAAALLGSSPVQEGSNVEPQMNRRSRRRAAAEALKRGRSQNLVDAQLDHDLSSYAFSCHSIPENITEALKDARWKESTMKEISSLFEMGTFEKVQVDDVKRSGGRIVPLKWVFKAKLNSENVVTKLKSRLVVLGNLQKFGQDFQETYAPVINTTSLRYVFDLAARSGMVLHSMDVSNAFVQSPVDKDIYVSQIPGYEIDSKYCYKLVKSLYGLKQAPMLWNQRINKAITGLGFTRSVDPCLYFSRSKECHLTLLALYVDDIIVGSTCEEECVRVKLQLREIFKCEDNGVLTEYLGLNVVQHSQGIFISQPGYIERMYEKFQALCVKFSKDCDSPMSKTFDSNPPISAMFSDDSFYRSLVGGLLYASVMSRPDIAYAVGKLCRYVSSPRRSHVRAGFQILRYLFHTKDMGICYANEPHSIRAYADSDWASCKMSRKSTSGYVIFRGGPLCWKSRLQDSVALSSSEAETVSLSLCCTEVVFLRKLIEQVEAVTLEATKIYEDNYGCREIAKHPSLYTKMKHVEMRHLYCQEVVQKGWVSVEEITSKDQVADVLTKAEDGVEFQRKRGMLGMMSKDEFISGLSSLKEGCRNHKINPKRLINPLVVNQTDAT